MAMTATMTVPSNVIAGRPCVVMLAIANSGASDVTVTSVNAIVTPSNTSPGAQPSVVAPPVIFPVGRTSTVSASGTLNVPMELVFNFPQTPGNMTVMPGSTFLLDAMIQVSDLTCFSVTVPQWVSVSSGAPSPSQGYGQLAFNDGRNLINVAAV